MDAITNYWRKNGLSDLQINSAMQQLMPEVDKIYSSIKGTYSGNTMSITFMGEKGNFVKM